MALIPGNIFAEAVQEGVSGWGPEASATLTHNDATHSYFGGTALKMSVTGGAAWFSTDVLPAVTGSTTYYMSVRCYSSATREFAAGVDWYTSGDVYISSTNWLSGVSTATSFPIAVMSATSPSNAAKALGWVTLNTDSANGEVMWWDQFCVRTTAGKPNAQTAAGSMTAAGALARQANKKSAGSSTGTGVITQRTTSKGVAGTTTATGVPSKLVSKFFTGTTTLTGALAAGLLYVRAVAGVVTSTGSLIKATSKKLVGSITGVGAPNPADYRFITGNLIGNENCSFESGTAPWLYVNDANLTSIADSTAQAYHGTHSALVVVTTTGVQAEWGSGADGAALSASTAYTLSVRIRARDTARNLQVQVNEFTAAPAYIGTDVGGAGTAGSTTTIATTDWTTVYRTFTTDATCDNVAIFPFILPAGQAVAGEGFYIDYVCLRTSATLPSNGNVFTQAVAGAIAAVGALVRLATKQTAGSSTGSGTLVRSISSQLVGAVTATGTLVKFAQKTLDGSVTASGALAAARTFFQTLVGSIAMVGVIQKTVTKNVVGTTTGIGSLASALFLTYIGRFVGRTRNRGTKGRGGGIF